jgi:nucleotide-binding universal stress UspA family protein
MIQSILIGLDGSPRSENTLALGTRWARRTGALLIGVGVVDEAKIRKTVRTGPRESYLRVCRAEEQVVEARQRVTLALESFAQHCQRDGVSCRTLERTGEPGEAIAAEAEDIDLTILSQHHDATLDTVLHQSCRPIVAVPDNFAIRPNVVIAYDASPASVRALEAFQRSALEDWQIVTVVSVDADLAVASRHADEAVKYLRHFNTAAVARPLVSDRSIPEVLHAEVQDHNAGMLVMGAFGRAGAFSTSTTETILKQSAALLFLHH